MNKNHLSRMIRAVAVELVLLTPIYLTPINARAQAITAAALVGNWGPVNDTRQTGAVFCLRPDSTFGWSYQTKFPRWRSVRGDTIVFADITGRYLAALKDDGKELQLTHLGKGTDNLGGIEGTYRRLDPASLPANFVAKLAGKWKRAGGAPGTDTLVFRADTTSNFGTLKGEFVRWYPVRGDTIWLGPVYKITLKDQQLSLLQVDLKSGRSYPTSLMEYKRIDAAPTTP